ncbi:helix-turn-helix transcriptional regulator [Roseateles chitinivorans]|uniref:helix-turn-helix transcriptional regulator n=1 Tax=Roseateles chitinivorans TaxID=2917965 RepID=UPI003D67BA4B
MSAHQATEILDRQLLLQLGERLRRLRKSQGLGTVDMAAKVGVTRNTLRAVEAGDPATSIGTYLRVMSVLGVSGELALLAGDVLQPPPADSAAARSRREAPAVRVEVSASNAKHRLQDLQSIAMHQEAVRLAKADPALIQKAQATVERWLSSGDARSATLWREWQDILSEGAWRKVLGATRRAQQLRQTSPLVTILPEEMRQRILRQVNQLKNGVILDSGVGTPPAESSETP